MSKYMKWTELTSDDQPRLCPQCGCVVEVHEPGVSHVAYEGELYHVGCAKEAIEEYDKWDDSTDARGMQLVGEVIADWIAKRELHRDADAFARRNSGLIKATLFLQSVLGPASHSIASPRRVRP